jgi:hypothetical protein
MAPEVYNDEAEGAKVRDLKSDDFSFGLIVYEILCGGRVFPSTMSAAAIMRRAMSTKASDRPAIPSTVPPVLREMIARSWIRDASRRPTMEWHWKRMSESGFRLLPNVAAPRAPPTPADGVDGPRKQSPSDEASATLTD